jgi:hypothetical protein
MSTNYRELLPLMWICFVVPGAVSIAPAAMTRSRIVRWAIHIVIVGFGFSGFVWIPVGPLRRSIFVVLTLALMQYWAVVLLEEAFEKHYGRAPQAMFLVSRLHVKWEDRLMSLAYWVLVLAAMFVVIAVSPPFA